LVAGAAGGVIAGHASREQHNEQGRHRRRQDSHSPPQCADTIEVDASWPVAEAAATAAAARDLGTGKTTLVKVLRRLWMRPSRRGYEPTFTLLHEYDGALDGRPVKLFHLDVYRLEGEGNWRHWLGRVADA